MTTTTDGPPPIQTTSDVRQYVLDEIARGFHVIKNALDNLEPTAELALAPVEAADPIVGDIAKLAPEAKTIITGLIAMLRDSAGHVDPTTSPGSTDSGATSTTGANSPSGTPMGEPLS